MPNNISSISTKITANADGFAKTMDRVQKQLEKLDRMEKKSASLKPKVQPSKLNEAGKMFSSKLGTSGLTSVLKTAGWVGLLVTAVFTARDAVNSLISKTEEYIKTAIKQNIEHRENAILLGESTEAYADFALALERTGVEGKVAFSALSNLNKALHNATMGGGFNQSVLKQLGLNISQLRDKTPVENFKTIATRMNSIKNDTQKAAIAYALFNDNAKDVLRLLDQSGKGLININGEARKLGLVMSDEEVNRFRQANFQFQEMSNKLQGVATQLAVKLLPALLAFLNYINRITPSIMNMSKSLGIAGDIGTFVVYSLVNGMLLLGQTVGVVVLAITRMLKMFTDMKLGVLSFLKLVKPLQGLPGQNPALSKLLESIAIEDEISNTIKQMNALDKKTMETVESLKTMENAKMTWQETKQYVADVVKEMDRLAKNIDSSANISAALQRGSAASEYALQTFMENMSPLEVFNQEMLRLNTLLKDNVIEWELYARAVGKAVLKLEQAANFGDIRLPAGQSRFSAEAVSSANRSRMEYEQKNRDNAQQRIERLQKESIGIQKRIEHWSEETARAVKNRVVVQVNQ